MSQSQPIDQSHLTSYALGELNAAERAKVETYLISHPEARQEVEDLKSLAELLSSELKAESMPGLDPARRAEIEALSSAPKPRSFFARLDARPFAAAAGIIIAVGGAISFGLGKPEKEPSASERAAYDSNYDVERLPGTATADERLDREFAKVDKDQAVRADRHAEEQKLGTELDAVLDVLHNSGRSDLELRGGVAAESEPNSIPVDSKNGDAKSKEASLSRARARFFGAGEPGQGGFSVVPNSGLRGDGPHSIGGAAPSGAGSSGGYAPSGAGSPGPGPGPAGGGTGFPGGEASKWTKIENRGPIEIGRSAEGRRKSGGEDSFAAPVDIPVDSLVTRHNAELAAKDDASRSLRESSATKEALIEEEKKSVADSVDELEKLFDKDVIAETRVVRDRLSKLERTGTPEAKREVEALVRRVRELENTARERRLKDEVRRTAGEDYSSVIEQPFKVTTTEPLSTIGLDIDTASYANVRRYLQSGQWPPRDAVRVDEMVNYFHYNDPAPKGEENLAIHAEVAACPWNMENRLLRVAFKAKEVAADERGATNLVFLVDVSGSMRNNDKLPLLKEGLKALTRELKEDDSVAIVTYASGVRVALEPTYGNDQAAIINVLDSLSAGGSTNGAGGIQMAYEMAQRHFVDGGTNRVLLCTDGDFNVGVSDTDELTRMITEKAQSGVFLSVLGFGTGNIKDGRMQALANKGNGHYAYIDSDHEAQKVLVDELSGTLVTVAKDAKLQIEFSPAEVSSWRLLGYSARILQAQDFNDDKKDAGEIGAGHSVIALYEIEPARKSDDGRPAIDPLKYQKTTVVTPGAPGEIASVRLRYKLPDAVESRLRTLVVMDEGLNYGAASADFKLSASVALFGMLLSKSEFAGQTGLAAALELAEESINSANDQKGWRREFAELIRKAIAIRERENPDPQRR